MDSQQFIEMIEDAGCDTRSYSGRGMSGKQCVAFKCDRGTELYMIIEILSEATHNYEQEQIDELAKILRGARTDDIGLGTIVYFPAIEHPDSITA